MAKQWARLYLDQNSLLSFPKATVYKKGIGISTDVNNSGELGLSTLDFYLVLINRHEKKSGNREEDGCDQNTLLPFRMDDLRRDFGSIYKGITEAHCFGSFVVLSLSAWKPETNTLCCVLLVCGWVCFRHSFSTPANLYCPRGSCVRCQNWGCPAVTSGVAKQKPGN